MDSEPVPAGHGAGEPAPADGEHAAGSIGAQRSAQLLAAKIAAEAKLPAAKTAAGRSAGRRRKKGGHARRTMKKRGRAAAVGLTTSSTPAVGGPNRIF